MGVDGTTQGRTGAMRRKPMTELLEGSGLRTWAPEEKHEKTKEKKSG